MYSIASNSCDQFTGFRTIDYGLFGSAAWKNGMKVLTNDRPFFPSIQEVVLNVSSISIWVIPIKRKQISTILNTYNAIEVRNIFWTLVRWRNSDAPKAMEKRVESLPGFVDAEKQKQREMDWCGRNFADGLVSTRFKRDGATSTDRKMNEFYTGDTVVLVFRR